MSATRKTIIEIAAGAPQNATAAKVLGKGVHWTPKMKLEETFFREEEGCPPVRKPTSGLDLTGQRFGRFVVKGLGPVRAARKAAVWIVRCDCGAYEHRKAATLRSLSEDRLACSHCDRLDQIRKGKHNHDHDLKITKPGGAAQPSTTTEGAPSHDEG